MKTGVTSKLEYTDTTAVITQQGFFTERPCRIIIPIDSIDLVAKTLSDMYFQWQNQIHKIHEHKRLCFELELPNRQRIDIEEGVGNLRNQDFDRYAFYDLSVNTMFSQLQDNVVVFKMQGCFILAELLKTKQTFNWDDNK